MMKKVCFLTVLALIAMLTAAPRQAAAQRTLRVCADPDYMPYSNRAQQGLENKIAAAVGRVLGDTISYAWETTRGTGGWDQFIHDTLNADACDVVMDVPYASQSVLTTDPYYVSSYVFVFDKNKGYDITSLDSPQLRKLKIGYESDTPPEDGLKLRGMLLDAVPFDVGGTQGQSPSIMLQALRDGRIQVAITWEPAIGYFLRDANSQLDVQPLPNSRGHGAPEQYIFPMSMGVRLGNEALKNQLNSVIGKHQSQLVSILGEFGVKLYHPSVSPY